ncbi:hypothetical protein [Fibrobacter sp.]|uniref:hypothetical protein n=1 Tax=Fibrobacter sp. TaxID=35828 RepID=UPI0025BA3771|nr:hypothetical protein [Fibrobacter sp.]MCI6437188.1 hypothetical protein [Fibrobacter sp.]
MGNAQRALAREGSDGTLSFYVTGEPGKNFEDLCAGPHVPSTGKLKNFKVLSMSGAYWHGDQNSDQLTRVYGTCFADKEGLETYLKFLEEAEKRDHRMNGKEKRASRVSRRKACFSTEAQPRTPKASNGPLPHRRPFPGHGVLASEGHQDGERPEGLHPR